VQGRTFGTKLTPSSPGRDPGAGAREDALDSYSPRVRSSSIFVSFPSGWKAKFDGFETWVSNGWHYPAIDVAMNKLCYIDQHASFKYYLHSMTNLEAAFPQTVIVYTTMPLMTDADGDNFLRNAFNERLREWTQQNGRVLFDIADIEAHDPNGKVCTFQYRNKTYQKLCDSYTKDGGHLNEAGRQLVAKGFCALAAALTEKERAPALSVDR